MKGLLSLNKDNEEG